MNEIWPGDLTLVFFARPEVPVLLTAGTGKIGIRLPGHPVAAALVEAAGRPITGTSANLAGRPGAATIQDLPDEIADHVDLILDAGPLKGGAGSIVVSHANDSYFWVVTQFSGLRVADAYRSYTLMTLWMGLATLLLCLALFAVL